MIQESFIDFKSFSKTSTYPIRKSNSATVASRCHQRVYAIAFMILKMIEWCDVQQAEKFLPLHC